MEDIERTKVEVTFDNASTYISKYFLYGATKRLFSKYPHLKVMVIRWVPLCPVNGKTNLDHRFSNFTYFVNAFQLSQKIGSIEKMHEVLTDGIKGSNLRRREQGLKPLPTSVNIFELSPPTPRAPYVLIPQIKSQKFITYIMQSSQS